MAADPGQTSDPMERQPDIDRSMQFVPKEVEEISRENHPSSADDNLKMANATEFKMTSKLENVAEERIAEPKGNTEDTMYLFEKPNSIGEYLQTSKNHHLEEHSYFLKEVKDISKEQNHYTANRKLDMVTSLMRISTGEVIQPFNSDHYKIHSYQKIHAETHISFNCEFCDFTSQDKIALTLHVRKHEPFMCDLCGHMDSSESGLEKHFKTKHSEEVEEIVIEKNSSTLDSGVKIVSDTKCSTSKLENGTENGVESGTENGVESGTEKAVKNGTGNGVESGTENGVESGTEKAVENCTGNGVESDPGEGVLNGTENGPKYNNRGPISSLEKSSSIEENLQRRGNLLTTVLENTISPLQKSNYIGGKFETRGNLPIIVLGNIIYPLEKSSYIEEKLETRGNLPIMVLGDTISPLERSSNIGENLYTIKNHPGTDLHLIEHSYFSQEVKESSKDRDSLSVNIKLASPSSDSSSSKLENSTIMEGAGPRDKNGETISILEKSSCIGAKPSEDHQPIENYLRKYLPTTREITDRKYSLSSTKFEMVSSLKWISLGENIQYFNCKLCQYKTISAVLLNRHVKKVHSEKPRGIINCEYCDYTCQKKVSYIMHVRKHTNCKPSMCELCGRKSLSRSGLRLHMRKHLKELEEMSKVKEPLSLVNNKLEFTSILDNNTGIESTRANSVVGDTISSLEKLRSTVKKLHPCENLEKQSKISKEVKEISSEDSSSLTSSLVPTSKLENITKLRVTGPKSNILVKSCSIGEKINFSEERNNHEMHMKNNSLSVDSELDIVSSTCQFENDSVKSVSVPKNNEGNSISYLETSGSIEEKLQSSENRNHQLKKHSFVNSSSMEIVSPTFQFDSGTVIRVENNDGDTNSSNFVGETLQPSENYSRIHLNTDTNKQRSFNCGMCEYKGVSTRHVLLHLRLHSGEQNFICGLCEFKTDQIRYLKKHLLRKHMDKKLHTCTQCDFKSCSPSFMRKHLRTHAGAKLFSCQSCEFSTARKTYLKTHFRNVHSVPTAVEEISREQDPSSENSKIEIVTPATSSTPYNEMEVTGVINDNISGLETSSSVGENLQPSENCSNDTDEKPFTCEFCSFRTAQPASLRVHRRQHTGEISCDLCNYKATTRSHLKRHARIHSGEKPFICDICDCRFSQRIGLKIHLRKHTGEKPYTCEQCDYESHSPAYMANHIRRHTGEKRISCQFCEYRCNDASLMKNHVRRHTGERPFKCEFCSFTAALKSSLQSHLRTHTGETRINCKFCPYKCYTASCMKRHTRTHTGEKPYKCHVCEFSTALKTVLANHVRRRHSVSKEAEENLTENVLP